MSLDIGDTATCLNRPVWQQLRDGKVLHSSSLDEDTKVEEWYLKTDVASCWCSCSHLVDLYIYLFFISPSHLKLFSVAAAASITFCFVFRPCACSHLVQKVETSSKQLFFFLSRTLCLFFTAKWEHYSIESPHHYPVLKTSLLFAGGVVTALKITLTAAQLMLELYRI